MGGGRQEESGECGQARPRREAAQNWFTLAKCTLREQKPSLPRAIFRYMVKPSSRPCLVDPDPQSPDIGVCEHDAPLFSCSSSKPCVESLHSSALSVVKRTGTVAAAVEVRRWPMRPALYLAIAGAESFACTLLTNAASVPTPWW